MKFATATDKKRLASAFTLVEVLAALMFMAIVIPVAVDALRIASLSGEFATRKAEAARVADGILNESIVTTNWNSVVSGTVVENGHEFRYTLKNQGWLQDSTMLLLTAEVTFSAGGRQCAVRLNTLANPTSTGVTPTMAGTQ